MKRKLLVAMTMVLFIGLGLLAGCSSGEEDHGHEHGEEAYEWSGEYELTAGEYSLEFMESEKDPSIMVAFILLDETDKEGIEHLAQHVMEADDIETIEPNATFIAKDQYAYDLQLNPEGTGFTFEIEKAGTYMVFAEHFAWEFDMKIMDSNGMVIQVENEVEYAEPHDH